jgi:hypothetical protein
MLGTAAVDPVDKVRHYVQEELEKKHRSWIAGLPVRPYLRHTRINTAFASPFADSLNDSRSNVILPFMARTLDMKTSILYNTFTRQYTL